MFVKARRAIANPNTGFVRQLEIYGLAGCDLHSDEGKRLYQEWQKERDAAYMAKVKALGIA
jgi:hypothetical protein